MTQNILVIGGAGKQASVYIQEIFRRSNEPIRLVGIADVIDPASGPFSNRLKEAAGGYGVEWIPLAHNINADTAVLQRFVEQHRVDVLLISCPPTLHFPYIMWGLKNGLDVICDKPLVAVGWQSGDESASARLTAMYEDLIDTQLHGYAGVQARSPYVFVPLIRRFGEPYGAIIRGLRDVFARTDQSLTYFLATRSDGTYRFPDEFDRPGAHGYREGLGSFTQSAYHFIDFLGFCLDQAPPPGRLISASLTSQATVGDAKLDESGGAAFSRLLGRSTWSGNLNPFIGDRAELDFHLYLAFHENEGRLPDAEAHLSFVQRGCTRRVSPNYGENVTHDEGLTNDCVIVIHQGPIQSFHVLVAQDHMDGGRTSVVRRLNPRFAADYGEKTLSIVDYPMARDNSAEKNRQLLSILLDVCGGRRDAESYAALDIRAQARTVALYTAALGAQRDTWRAK